MQNADKVQKNNYILQVRKRYVRWREEKGEKVFRKLYIVLCVFVCLVVVATLLLASSGLPEFGQWENPTNNEVSRQYLEEGLSQTGATNAVAGMILDYRAFDTFGETCVLFMSVCAVLMLLRNEGKRDAFDDFLHEMEEPRHDIILKKMSMLLVPMIALFGVYIVFNGHLSPGGGFSGGAIMGSALILFASSYGTKKVRKFFSYKTFERTVFASLMFYALAKSYSFFVGANHIESIVPLGTPGSLFSGGLILPLNICVGLVVCSTMYVIYVLFSKGEML